MTTDGKQNLSQQERQSENEHSQPAKEHEKSSNKPPENEAPITGTPSDIPPPPGNPPNSNHDKNPSHRELPTWTEIGLFWLEAAGIVGLSYYCYINYLEWKTFDSERQTMETEFKTSQTNAAAQLNEMQKSREIDERAWVFVSAPDNSLAVSDTNLVFTAQLKNFGKTPALVTGDIIHGTVRTNDIPPRDIDASGDHLMLIPNQSGTTTIPIPPNWQAGMNVLPIYLYGTVFYRDIGGNKHWTQFCYCLRDGGKTFVGMNIHTSCDDIENAAKQ